MGGKWAGTELTSPGQRVRPTAEEVRAQWLDALDGDLEDARVADLFAGTGALGIEAMSRGAKSCDFVESGAAALHALKANTAKLRLRKSTRIFKRDALAFAAALDPGAYDVVFADPPYHSGQLDRLIDVWMKTKFSRILTVEHAADHKLPRKAQRTRFGDTAISIYHVIR